MNKNSLYAFYGSLRRNMDNYEIFDRHLIFIGTTQLQRFKMYSLGEYPYIIRTENISDKIVVELFKVNNRNAEQMIHQMEIEAGYIFDEIEIAKQKFGIYLFSKPYPHHAQIPSGDWVLYKRETGF